MHVNNHLRLWGFLRDANRPEEGKSVAQSNPNLDKKKYFNYISSVLMSLEKQMAKQGTNEITQENLDKALADSKIFIPGNAAFQHLALRQACLLWEFGDQLCRLTDHTANPMRSVMEGRGEYIMHPDDYTLLNSITRDAFYDFCQKNSNSHHPIPTYLGPIAKYVAMALPSNDLIDLFHARCREGQKKGYGDVYLRFFMLYMIPKSYYNLLFQFDPNKRSKKWGKQLDKLCNDTKEYLAEHPIAEEKHVPADLAEEQRRHMREIYAEKSGGLLY